METAIDDAAVEVVAFAKANEWPQQGSPDFFRFADIIDRLETAIRKKYPGAFGRPKLPNVG